METSKPLNKANASTTRQRTFALSWSWEMAGFGAVLILAAMLRLVGLDKNGYANNYYAAAVKSMLTSWHNFFFVSFDSAGFISVDKPPLALWLQTASAKIFGFSGFSILLPEALAGVGSVALIYYLVRRTFNPLTGLIAALILALTPISVAVDRNNTVDSILVFFLLIAAWAFLKATETGRFGWLALGSVLVGLGFNVKMIEAFLVLPAFYLVYLLGTTPRGWLKRGWQLGLASIIIVLVSFSWATIVDLTPASERPFVGSSSNNSVYNLIFDYNGIGRQTGTTNGLAEQGNIGPSQTMLEQLPPTLRAQLESQLDGAVTSLFESEAGIARLVKSDLAAQVSWLLPLILIGVFALVWRGKWHLPLNQQQQFLVLWGGWLVTCGLIFSFTSGVFHSYYLVMLAPAVAALAGAGLVRLWQDWQTKGWCSWLLPLAVVLTGLYAVYVTDAYPDWQIWLVPLIITLTVVSGIGLIVLRWWAEITMGNNKLALAFLALSLVTMLAAPTAWALTPVIAEGNGALPEANPGLLKGQNSNQLFAGNYDIDQLVAYLETNRQGAAYLLATLNATTAAPIVLKSGQPVMALGGFIGKDTVLTVDQLAQLVKAGQVRYFLLPSFALSESPIGNLPAGGGFAIPNPNNNQVGLGESSGLDFGNQALIAWVQKECQVVEGAAWGGQTATSPGNPTLPFGAGGQKLYNCSTAKLDSSLRSHPGRA